MTVSAAVIMMVTLVGLWVRRHTWRYHWEVQPSVILGLQTVATMLLTPWAATMLGPWLHRVLGLWNVTGLVGMLGVLLTGVAMIAHLLSRLTLDSQGEVFGRRVGAALSFGLPLLVGAFVVGHAGYEPVRQIFDARGPRFAAFWAVLGGLFVYLGYYSSRLLLIIRADPRSKRAAELYLVWAGCGFGIAGCVWVTALFGSNVCVPAWTFGCIGTVASTWASIGSWRAKRRTFVEAGG